MAWRLALMLTLGAIIPRTLSAQAPAPRAPTDSLYRTIAALDSAIFDAYNRCDLRTLGGYFAPDLEFYDDQSGLSRGRAPMLADVKKYVCGKARRDLVPGTMEVHPLKGYGAVQTGRHLFCDPAKFRHCEEPSSGIADFVHVWQLAKGRWRITRVISYGHTSSHERSGSGPR